MYNVVPSQVQGPIFTATSLFAPQKCASHISDLFAWTGGLPSNFVHLVLRMGVVAQLHRYLQSHSELHLTLISLSCAVVLLVLGYLRASG